MINRDIKFRVWDKETEKLRAVTQLFTPKDESIQINTSKGWLDENAPLMQFTGLKDKNGKEIYEGDILEIHQERYTVVWFDKGACFRYWDRMGNLESPLNYDEVAVVGNIYENKSLLQ